MLLLPLPALNMMTPLLGFSIYWHLPFLVIVISLVYSATRYDEWGPILREALRWGRNLTLFLVVIGVVLFALASFIPN